VYSTPIRLARRLHPVALGNRGAEFGLARSVAMSIMWRQLPLTTRFTFKYPGIDDRALVIVERPLLFGTEHLAI
jgi:hypothetical protein